MYDNKYKFQKKIQVLRANCSSKINQYPNCMTAIGMLLDGMERFSQNFNNIAFLRISGGGEIKTLMRNVLEPLLNLAVNYEHSIRLNILSLVTIDTSRITLINECHIFPEELNAMELLYNYANGCDHLGDANNGEERKRALRYIKSFEILSEQDKYTVLLKILNALQNMITRPRVKGTYEYWQRRNNKAIDELKL